MSRPLPRPDPLLADALDRIKHLEGENRRICGMLARLLRDAERPEDLEAVRVLGVETDHAWFLSGAAWRSAETERLRAEVEGGPEPALASALRVAGVATAQGFGKWLAAREDAGLVERGPPERGGLLWRVRGAND